MNTRATRNPKLVAALSHIKQLQDQGRKVFRSSELEKHRGILLKNEYLKELIKGWYVFSSPLDQAGDTVLWNATWKEFIAAYGNQRFGKDWHLSPEQSLFLHSRNTVAPRQIILYAKTGQNNTTALKNGASIFDYKAPEINPTSIMILDGVRILTAEAALIQATEQFYKKHPLDAQIVLNTASDFANVLGNLLAGGKSVAAGRIAGAYKAVGNEKQAAILLEEMAKNGYLVTAANPFETDTALCKPTFPTSAFEQRLRLMWSSMRTEVLENFPPEPGIPADPTAFIKKIQDLYSRDAYHSLSIEGYRVTEGLIQRIREGLWNPEANPDDLETKTAFAAKGYQLAFLSVQASIEKILAGGNAAEIVSEEHQDWYVNLFRPSVASGMIEAADLYRYRNSPIFIRDSFHVPPSAAEVRGGMQTLLELLKNEPSTAVRAVLGHFIFVFIHPYIDGNGRMGRFIMNAFLASGGYPWTIIPVQKRADYLAALESASVHKQIRPFVEFIAGCID